MAPKSYDPPFDLQRSPKVPLSGYGKDSMGKLPPCDLDENRHTDRCLHAEQKSPWRRSRRTHHLTYSGHRRSNLPFLPLTSATSVGQTVGPTTSGPWRLLFSRQRSISTPIFIQTARGGGISHRVLAMSFSDFFNVRYMTHAVTV